MDYKLRNPKIEDARSGLEMINSLVEERSYITVQKKQTIKSEREYFKNLLKGEKEKSRVDLILDIDGKVMGSAGAWRIDERTRRHVGEFGVAIRKEARGKGLGRKLLEKTMERARKELKIKIATLFVYSKNKKAISLYEKSGFEKIGTIKKGAAYYGQLLDTNIMIKYL